ncbi:DUF58 domain-containing protein [Diplocloster agilis]|uniref:DUF58 domain-containing protein n=1 Tax=Diplocloster agilis TaxID=2850323 RepID=A0A949NFN4_9FIRM|nr:MULTISPECIES: DUF58 domain-containing protein [Lachnospiraceae]MBU9737884.1 DUF58 domain-containing protein [Diplocloster agilis]MCU6735324.1 DUF58 domain-containing protein [Suonthocola fibrivorans]SCJ70899.1 Uncharacterized conserved protein (some members contain a von Willebrand factor type A (vWA) domain) [uncultured Clostridium sp.]
MSILIYVLLLAGTFYLQIMFRWPGGVPLLACELVLPVFCLLMSWYLHRCVRAECHTPVAMAERGEEIPVELRIQNRSLLPVPYIRIGLECRYGNSDQVQRLKIEAGIDGRSERRIAYRINPSYCGRLDIRIHSFRIYDYLKLFFFRIRVEQPSEVYILPAAYPVNICAGNKIQNFLMDSDEFARDRPGDDPSEIFDIREYRPGDRPEQIHWKLSAREDALYVKEFSQPVGAAVLILLEGTDWPTAPEQWNSMLETAVSFSKALLSISCSHYVAWPDRAGREIVRTLVKDEETFYEMIRRLLAPDVSSFSPNALFEYEDAYPNMNFASILVLNTDLELKTNGEVIAVFSPADLKSQLETLELYL